MAAVRQIGRVGQVRRLAFKVPTIGLPQRQPPQRIEAVAAAVQNGLGQRIVVGKQSRQFGAQGNARRTGQGCGVEQQRRLFGGGLGQRIGQDDAALGIGVADLDAEPAARPDHVERPHGIAGDAVLDCRNQ
jgi:hypothetical protein